MFWKRLQHRLEYAAVRVVELALLPLPRPLALGLGNGIGLLFSRLLSRRRELVIANLTAAFPEKSPEDIRRIARGSWMNLGKTAIEFIRLHDKPAFHVQGRENVEKAAAQGKGVILVTLHFTNWEVMGVITSIVTGNMVAIARPMKNPYVEAWVQRKRAIGGMEIILHRQAVKASLRVLKDKKSIGILVDQNLYTGGVFVDFFGRPAATTPLPALLAHRTGAPLLIVYCLREKDGFRAIYEPALSLPEIEDQDERLRTHTQIISREIERVIRAHPENWFWIHNRWKRKEIPEAQHVVA